MSSYSMDAIQDGCYEGTGVLINKFDIRNENQLDEIETTIVSAKISQWLVDPLNSDFDFQHYKNIHKFLFSDLYDWAGNIRNVNISKKGTNFCDFKEIETRATSLFKYMKEKDFFKNQEKSEFVENITDFYCSTNELHPFREGNGRTQRVFIMQLSKYAGYDLELTKADVDLLMIATIQAANGVTELLKNIFNEIICKI